MSVHIAARSLLILLVLSLPVGAADKHQARLQRITDLPAQSLGSFGSFAAAEACTAGNDSAIAYWIEGWVTGNELYKAYIDPSKQCQAAYPFTVREVNMPMKFDAACSLTVSVDIETADQSDPNCHVPGEPLAISSDWQLNVPAAGGYMLWIPLDTPIVVTGPFFAGFFLTTAIAASVNPSIYCDVDPQQCFTFNIWDTTIGYIDLVNNTYYNFPGRLAMYVNGTTGGSSDSGCCSLSPGASIDFGTVPLGNFKDMMFTVANCGSSTMNGTISESCSSFSLASGGGSYSLAAGQSRTVTVRFQGTSAGVYSCTINTGLAACPTVTATAVYGSAEPAPQVALISPTGGKTLLGSVDLWAAETSGSKIIDYVSFEYSSGGTFTEIGRDFDGTHTLRDGVTPAIPGSGYNLAWNFANVAEGTYTLRVTAVDTLGRTASATTSAYLEPTPPVARITSPVNGEPLCNNATFLFQCNDENMTNIQLLRSPALPTYRVGLSPLSQHAVGDNNGNVADGNYASAGEFGDYYSAPVAAAVAIKVWADRNYISTIREGTINLILPDIAERFATAFKTRANKGTFDEDLLTGLTAYSLAHGDQLDFDYQRTPDYYALRTWAEDEQRTVMLGLGGSPGFWVAVNGFSGWRNADGTFAVAIMNPLTGTLQDAPMRDAVGADELFVNGAWHTVDLMVSMLAKSWTVSRPLLAADLSGADGWSITWTPTGLTNGMVYFFKAVGRDATTFKGYSTVLLPFSCQGIYTKGDFNGDGQADIVDLDLLINLVNRSGTPPVGGVARADCNGDGYINIADIVYYMNFLFGTSSAPCY